MSVESYQREVNSLDRDIANLEKKKSECDKKCAELQGKISSTLKSINKNTSDSMKSSKLRQINGYQDELNKKTKDSADLGKKIAEKIIQCSDSYSSERTKKFSKLEITKRAVSRIKKTTAGIQKNAAIL